MSIFKIIKDKFTSKGISVYQSVKEYKWDEILGGSSSEKYTSKFETSTYVYACVNKRAEKVSQIQFQVYDNKREQNVDHDILNVLYKPNAYQDKNEFFYTLQALKDLVGEVYIYIEKSNGRDVSGLHILKPDRMKVNISEDGDGIDSYEYSINNKTNKYEPDEIIHLKYPKPTDFIHGQSPLMAGALPIETEQQLSTYHYSILKNGGRVEGIIKTGKNVNLTESQIKTVKKQFKDHYSGAEKSGMPLVLYGEMEYVNLGLNPTELSYLKSKNLSRDDIFMLFGIPKVILSQTDGVNYANAKIGMQVFLSETIKPLVDAIVNKLDQELLPDKNLSLTYVDFVPKDKDYELKIRDNALQNGYMTINEVRKREGLEPVDGGDKLLIPFNKAPLE